MKKLKKNTHIIISFYHVKLDVNRNSTSSCIIFRRTWMIINHRQKTHPRLQEKFKVIELAGDSGYNVRPRLAGCISKEMSSSH